MNQPPPPYQAVALAPRGTLHIPIPQCASDKYSKPPSLPTTFSPSVTSPKRSLHRHLLTQNLWQEAAEKLPEKDKKSLELLKSGTSATNIVEDALARVKCSEERVNGDLITIKTKRGEVPLRHYVDKLTKVLIQFREIGDTIVQYDPGHAALPWAGVRLLLNIAVNDSSSFQDMAEGIDLVSAMITRYAVVESLYLLEDSSLKAQLTDGITKLYVAILKYLVIAKTYYDKSTWRRVGGSAIKSSNTLVEVPIAEVRTSHVEVDEILKIIDAERKRDTDRKISEIQDTAASTRDETERLRQLSRDMMRKLEPIDELTAGINEMRTARTREGTKQKFQWLSTVPVQSHHAKANQDLVADTGLWLMTRQLYIDWKQSTKSCAFLLHGSLGCGKTALMSVVIQQLLDEQKANPGAGKVAYFYCNASEQQRTKTLEILGAIARQLSFNGLDKPPEPAFLEAYEAQRKDADEKNADEIERLNVKTLTDLIPRLVGGRTAMILIDALDECAERLDLLKAIRAIMEKASIKVIISGRSEVCSDMPKDKFPIHVPIGQGENRDDIRKYVTAEMDRAIMDNRLLRGKVSDQLKETIVQRLNDSAQGMFLWVKLQLQTLCDEGIKREKDVLIELEKSPAEIGQLYQVIFDRIARSGTNSRYIAESVLQWLLISRRPLTIGTVLGAVSEASDNVEKFEVLDICRNLVIADDETDTFRFAHLSVQEFLEKREGYTNDTLHTFAAMRCLEEFESPRLEYDEETRPDPNSKCFYAYAVVNWVYHTLMVKDRSENLVERLESFLRDDDAFKIWNHDAIESIERQEYFLAKTDFEFPCLNGHKATQTFVIARFGLINAFEDQFSLDWNYNNIKGWAPIHVAAFAGNLEIVKRLIDEKEMDVNHQGETSFGPLLAACVNGHQSVVEYLLSVDGVEVNRRSGFGRTPLIAAIKAGNQNICRLLLENGALVNFQTLGNDTALIAAAMFGRLSIVQILLKKGADTGIVGFCKRTALLAAATSREEQFQEVVKLLVHSGADIDAQDEDGETSLHKAAENGDIDMVRLLISKKARVNVKNNAGKSALDLACAENESKVIEHLLKNGAICEPDAFGRTELHEAIEGGCDAAIIESFVSKGVNINAKDNDGFSALHLAARRGDKRILQILINAGAAVDVVSDSGLTLLHEAARGGSAEVVEHILGSGADLEARDNDKMTPLAVACCETNGSDDVVRVLLSAGANTSVIDKRGYSPLHELARNMRTKAALMLLETDKIDPALRTQSGISALDYAAGKGDYDLVRSLLERGASAQSEPGSDSALHWAVGADTDDNLYAIVERLLDEGCDINAKNANGCTPLHSLLAAKKGRENIVRLFLSRGADINMSDDDGDTVLNRLAQFPEASESMLELLLENKADASLANREGLTPLHKLARSGLAAHVRILLSSGASSSAKDKYNRQPIQYAARTNEATVRALLDFDAELNVTDSDWPSPIVYASSEATLQVLKLLLDGGADARSEDPGNPGWTALHAACERSDPDPAFAELLIEHGADVNAVTKNSKTTPLHNAVSSAAVVQLLLEEGALVDPQDLDGITPLSHACDNWSGARVVEVLIEAGADPMIKNKIDGFTSLHHSCAWDDLAPIVIHSSRCDDLNVETKLGWTPLIYAACSGRAGAVSCLLQTGQVKLAHETSDGQNAFVVAARFGSTEVLKLLIETDASIVLKADKRKNTALHMACSNGHLGVVKLLLETDASNIEAVNSANRTAFDLAAEGGYTDIVAFMLKRSDVDALHISWHNYTPLLWAAWSGKKDLIEMLMAVEGTDLSRMTTGGKTLFTIAAALGLGDLCRDLIDRGIANVTRPDLGGAFSPLHCATDSNKAGMLELLIAQPGVDKNVRSRDGFSPLWYAVRGENVKSVMTLLSHHVDVDTPDNRGRTPLLMAVQKGNQEIVRLLLTAGAKARLDEALESALAKRDKEIVQLLRDSGAAEHDEGFGLEELMTELEYRVPAFEEVQAATGAEDL